MRLSKTYNIINIKYELVYIVNSYLIRIGGDNMKKNIVLVGLGPHAKRIYIKLFKKHNLCPKLIVDLEENKSKILEYLSEIDMETNTYFVKNNEANFKELSLNVRNDLSDLIKKNDIKYAIISTEPKAHYAYAKFFIENDINILMDKPITAPIDVMNNIDRAREITTDFNELSKLYSMHQDKMKFVIQCQRRFHAGYMYIKNLLMEMVNEYKVPITYIDLYHCDGMWNMPDEFFYRENHPYKYGYGKLFHSGYHFIDLLAWLLECNNSLENKANKVDLYTTTFKPYDFFNTINNDFYHKYLKTDKFNEILNHPEKVQSFGELDVHTMLDFKNDDKTLTHCSVTLMQSGFSKRAWATLPEDTYKSNGRIRHERINIQLGPLMNIQVHSYQALEINDETNDNKFNTGGLDHFDIYIFRNNNLIGGKAFEKLSINDLLKKEENEFLGNNEKAREICFLDFLDDDKKTSDLLEHEKSILLLTKICENVASKSDKLTFDWNDYHE